MKQNNEIRIEIQINEIWFEVFNNTQNIEKSRHIQVTVVKIKNFQSFDNYDQSSHAW